MRIPTYQKMEEASLELAAGQVDVWRLPLDLPKARVQALWYELSFDERERAERFRLERDRQRFVAGRGQLRQVLGRYLQVASAQILFGYAEWDKPFVRLPQSALKFNLSHSDNMGYLALQAGGEIGIDVERVREIEEMALMVEDVFAPSEQRAWREFAEAERPLAFFAGWTRKEAIVKAIGQGLSHPLHTFAVELNPQATEPATTLPGWQLIARLVEEDFLLALATQTPIEQLNWYTWEAGGA